MNWPTLVGLDLTAVGDRLAQEVEDTAKNTLADWNAHRPTGVDAILSTTNTVRASQGDATYLATAKVLAHLTVKCFVIVAHADFGGNGVVDVRKVVLRELSVES